MRERQMTELDRTRADKLAIAELAQRERAARDARDWDALLDSYHHPDTRVRVSWFDGTAADFVEGSRRMVAKPGGGSIHTVGVTIVDVNGDRALADTGCAIHLRAEIDGVECDMVGYCRHRSRVERRNGRWGLLTLIGVYQKDTLTPTIPGTAPDLDEELLATFRPSYRFLSYYAAQLGYEPANDRAGVDRPDLVNAQIEEDLAWLAREG